MRLTIGNVSQLDYGSYQCLSKNIVGAAEATIKLYRKFLFKIMPMSHFIVLGILSNSTNNKNSK